MSEKRFSALSPAERNLVRLMQSIDCGRLLNLTIQDRQPWLAPPLKVVRRLKVRRSECQLQVLEIAEGRRLMVPEDFVLRREVVDLINLIREGAITAIDRMEILDGLPTLIELVQPVSPIPSTETSTPMHAA